MRANRQKTIAALALWVLFLATSGFFSGVSRVDALGHSDEEKTFVGEEKPIEVKGEGDYVKHVDAGWKLFLVGTNLYDKMEGDLIKYAVKDAEALKKRFIELGVPQENITILTSDSRNELISDKENIENAFKKFIESLKKGDCAFVYLSGHCFSFDGGKSTFYVPRNVDVSSKKTIVETSVSIDDMKTALEDSDANLKWMSVDACRNAPTASAVAKGIHVPVDDFSFGVDTDLNLPGVFIFMSSCGVGQLSYESQELQQGLMTYAMLEALQIDDNPAAHDDSHELKLVELLSYVQNRTDELAHKHRDSSGRPLEQRPVILVKNLHDVVILTNLQNSNATDFQRDKPEDAEQSQKHNQADEYYKEAQTAFKAKEYASAKTYLDEALALYEAPEYLKFRNGLLTVGVKAAVNQAIVDLNLQKAKSLNKLLAELDAKAAKENESRIAELEQPQPVTPVTPSPEVKQDASTSPRPDQTQNDDSKNAGDLQTLTIAGVKVNFRWAPAGTFQMGSPESEEGRFDNETQHKVTLSKGFWIAETETTQELWEAVMGNNPSDFTGNNQLPVDSVSWNDCREFVQKLNASYRSALPSGYKYAMPTEAQWEYACRAGTTTPFNFGSVLNGDKANCDGNGPYGTRTKGANKAKTTRVKSYAPNVWGLYDMHGNVWEWCADWYGSYDTSSSVTSDPAGSGSGSYRVLRGGSWCNFALYCRSAYRNDHSPEARIYDCGFRLALVR